MNPILPRGDLNCPLLFDSPTTTRLELLETVKAGTKRYGELNAERVKLRHPLKDYYRFLESIYTAQYKYRGVCPVCIITYLEFYSFTAPEDSPVTPTCKSCLEKK